MSTLILMTDKPFFHKIFATLLAFILCLGVSLSVLGQFNYEYNPHFPPNSYRSPDNPYYWKNKMPKPGYWQQDVLYKIKADIDEEKDIISATQTLTYWNNSPDTLDVVYFHLYQNAFQPNSYCDALHRGNGDNPEFGRYEKRGLGTVVESAYLIGFNPEKPIDVDLELDNTILKVKLPYPIPPLESVSIKMDFKTYFDSGGDIERRMKTFKSYGNNKHYDGVLWYPRICVYDHKFGWHIDQHLGREFYGDFGTFNVELTFANDFIVEATGNLLNKKEVMPDSLRQALDIVNFKNKEWNSRPSTVIKREKGKRKVWKYYAENVHDFAFTADPNYRIGETEWNGVKCISMVQEQHASQWQNAADYTAKVVEVYSNDIGMYAWPKIIVADARDGMEYPMITLDGGFDPSYRALLAHEIGHMWFYGMVGNNETYRAALDEGFTQFLTAWSMEKIDGEHYVTNDSKFKYYNKYKKPIKVRDGEVYSYYINDAMKGDDPALNTHSDSFHGAQQYNDSYWQVYNKTATMLYNLQYVLGDELFLKCMKNYFAKWKMAHPYFDDMQKAFIEEAGTDLHWFFDQWLKTNKNVDYAIKKVKNIKGGEYEITFERLGDMQMPIDFRVISKTGEEDSFYIPNTEFNKKTNATILPKWYGWDNINRTYTATVNIPDGIKDVVIDPSERLADINMLNNSKRMRVDWEFDSRMYNNADRNQYVFKYAPVLWYNSYDGIKLGGRIRGNYLKYRHITDLTLWANTRLLNEYMLGEEKNGFEGKQDWFSFNFDYETTMDKYIPKSKVFANAKWLDGLNSFKIGLNKRITQNSNFIFQFQADYRHNKSDLHYLHHSNQWNYGKWNNSFEVAYVKKYNEGIGSGNWKAALWSSSLGSEFDFNKLYLTWVNRLPFSKFQLNSRFFGQFGSGNDVPLQSALYLAGANPDQMMDNRFTRSRGIIPGSISEYTYDTNQFHYGGGLNIRGYAGYTAVDAAENDTVTFVYQGLSGLALNLELEFGDLLRFSNPTKLRRYFRLDPYLFADLGILTYASGYRKQTFAKERMDAGAGIALTIKRYWILEDTQPLVLRFDMPLILSRPPFSDDESFKFRWQIGINRAF